jgi:hypothetical protein
MAYAAYLATIEACELTRVAGVADGLVQEFTAQHKLDLPGAALLATRACEVYQSRPAEGE